jgi:hypothetical protein
MDDEPRPPDDQPQRTDDQSELHPAILASDDDRDRSIEQLGTAVSEGRMSLEEFSDRVELAHAARTQLDLELLTRDLPAHRYGQGSVAAHDRHLAFCSKLVRRGPWELEPRTSFRCIFGTVVLDLSEARLSGTEIDIEVYNLFGTVTVIVPDGVQTTISGGGLFASQVVDTPSRPTVSGGPRLRIKARGPGGTLYVRNSKQHPEA